MTHCVTLLRRASVAAFAAAALAMLAPAVAAAQDQINLNTASEEDLARLPGVGPAGARRIVEWRELNGPFQTVDDLARIRSLPAGTLDRVRSLVFAGPGAAPVAPREASGVGGLARAPVKAGEPQTIVAQPEGGGEPATAEQVAQILARYRAEPSVREVQEAALRYAEVHPEVLASWRSRSRVAALGPQIRGEYRYMGDANDRLKTGGADPDTLQQDIGLEHRGLARAQWDLDRLIFNADELRVSGEISDLVRLRESVLDQTTRLYYERRRLQVDLDLTPPRDLAGRVRKELRLQELAADLDAMTGGFFTRRLAERGLAPY